MQVLMHDWWWELRVFSQKIRIFSQDSLYEDYSKNGFFLADISRYSGNILKNFLRLLRAFREYSENIRRTRAFEGYSSRRERHSGYPVTSHVAKPVCILEERGCRAQRDRSVLSNTRGRRSRICGDRVS